jgi:ABC-2 type transport system permease protein
VKTWIPLVMLFRREVHRFLKVAVQTVFTPLISSLLYLLVFGVTLGSRIEPQMGVSYLAFLIPGLCMMGLMTNAFQNSSSSVTIGKFTGELEELKVLPISENQIVTAMSGAAVIRGLVVASVTYTVGSVVYYWQTHEALGVAHPIVLIYFVVMGGLVFGCLGISVAFLAKTFDQISAVSSFILLPLTYLGGVFISIERFNPFWQAIAKMNPMLYLINGLRYGILGVSDVEVGLSAMIALLCFGVFYGIARWSLHKASFGRW